MGTTDGDEDWTAVIIEDDPDVRDLIEIVLTQSGFRTIVAEDGPEGVEAVRVHEPLLTTLDVNMPGMDGFAVAKRLREFSSTYLIMITALADEIDVVQGFEAGADDYLVKPFRPRELRARADSMLRRPRARQDVGVAEADAPPTAPGTAAPAPSAPAPARPAPAAAPPTSQAAGTPVRPVPPPVGDGWVRFADLAVHPENRATTLRGAPVDLNNTEFDLLASLLQTGRRVRSKADLVLTMRGQQYVTSYFVNEADKTAVEEHVASLRRKLGDEGPRARYVETVRGVGYRMAEEQSAG